jgi:hypothetical protein
MHSNYKDCHEKPGSNKKKTREKKTERWRARLLICVNQERKREKVKKKKVKTTIDNLFLYDIYLKKTRYMIRQKTYNYSFLYICAFLANEMKTLKKDSYQLK